jgi:hypothetical protein
MEPLVYLFVIGFIGAVLFLLVDKYEPNDRMANLLKGLVLLVSSIVILHELWALDINLFSSW